MDKKKPIDMLPEEFADVDEAIAFWDIHDTTDYLDVSKPIKVKSKFRARHFEIEVDLNIIKLLQVYAKQQGLKPGVLANVLLHRQLTQMEPLAQSI